jgi:integrase
MANKRGHNGAGTIDKSGEGAWRLRYRINAERFAKHVKGTKQDAARELRRLLREGDTGEHVAPDKTTLGDWIDHWISIGAPGRRKKRVGRRTLERYTELLRTHVTPTLGKDKLQALQAIKIDQLYAGLEGKISARTAHHVHTVFNACLGAAIRKGLLSANPIARAEKVPSPDEADHGMALEADQLRTLVDGFKGSVLFPIVATLAFTGCRRNEALALRWTDLDVAAKTLRIERALEETEELGISFKGPKTERGKRTITVDDDLIALIVAEREKYLRLVAGVPSGIAVNLSWSNWRTTP